MAIGDVIQCRFVSYHTDQVAINVRHYFVESVTAPEPTLQQVASQLDIAFFAFYRNVLNEHARWRGVGAKKIFPLPESVEFVETANDSVGLNPGDLLPGATCGLLSFRGSIGGRRGRGRTYTPFPGEPENAQDGRPTVAYTAQLTALLNEFLEDQVIVNGAGNAILKSVIYNRGVALMPFNFIVAGSVRPEWATQRRRSRQGGSDALPF